MRIIVYLIAAYLCLSRAAFAVHDGTPDGIDMPVPINTIQKRSQIAEKLPDLPDGDPSLASLTKYIGRLELFRANVLEGYNDEILQNCLKLKVVERNMSRMSGSGLISRHDREELEQLISEEREQCDVKNKPTSRYFKIYDSFLEIYKNRISEANDAVAACYSSSSCAK